jgi:6-phosphogluconate dehydrogenase
MKLGFVGLGKMGGNMVRRLLADRHEVVAWARGEDSVKEAVSYGAVGAASLEDVVARLSPPRVVWLMIPAGNPVESSIAALRPILSKGDVIVDGGNSRFTDSARRAADLAKDGIGFLDAGTSGGIWGRQNGYCLMVGGEAGYFRTVEPVFRTLAPPDGYAHVGAAGSGHFVKMVHNAVEYAMLQGYGEGFEMLQASGYDMDLLKIARLWTHASVVRSCWRSSRTRSWPRSRDSCRTRGKDGGRSTRRSSAPFRCRRSRPRSSPGSRRVRTSPSRRK